MRSRFALALGVVLALPAGRALALQQPNGTTIPTQMGCHAGQPTGLAAVFACACDAPAACNIGAVCAAPGACDDGVDSTCETTLAHTFNDNTCIPSQLSGLDPVAEASTTPETFRPTCALTFTVESRGTATFKDAFGWYNVTGSAPAASDLHVMLACDAAAGAQAVLDIQNNPAYAGGEVGFFLITPEAVGGASGQCAGGDCCARVDRLAAGQGRVYYSQRAFNPDAAGAQSFIHLLVYDSHIEDAKFYFAWEDIFGGSNNDFTDLVTSVRGVECSGGGLGCDTGEPGACALGVSVCAGAGDVSCQGLVEPESEVCNAVDDDCDGAVDDGATCPDAGEVCVNGRCLSDCRADAEFDCPAELTCDPATGKCIDAACVGVTCPADQVCRGGACVGACDGIVCPGGSTCVNGACVARCDGVDCGDGQVCREGLCFPGCNGCGGIACAGAASVCSVASGECEDPSCPGGCPAGSLCASGTCVDACEGAVCPPGQVCSAGRCVPPGEVPDAGPGGGGGGGAADGDRVPLGCGCRAGGGGGGAGLGLGALGLLLAIVLVRRRRPG